MKKKKAHRVFLGLGSNLGNRQELILRAFDLIGERVGKVLRRSSLIETEPWGFESEHRFLNGVILCETVHTPRQLLAVIQQIERELGKQPCHATRHLPNSAENAPQCSQINVQRAIFSDRPIDIDILLYDDLKVDEPDLKIPHPLMSEREFVMKPLAEIQNKKPRE